MAKEYQRTDRVADFLKRELATLLQFQIRDPRVGMVSITDVKVSRDLGYAKVYCTVLGKEDAEQAEESIAAMNKAAGFMRSQLSKDSSMRRLPQLRFYFDNSVGHGAYLEDLIERAVASDDDGTEQ